MKIVRAAAELAGSLSAMALAAKRHWRYPEPWIEIWTPILTLTPEYVTANPTFAAIEAGEAGEAGEVIGFYALVVSRQAPRVQLDHLWLAPAWIGRGLGRTLFEHAAGNAAALGGAILDIEAEPFAEAFYLHMGARRVGERASQIDGQPRLLPLMQLDLPAPPTPPASG
jgi:GNAT superfamily N-acetyltransferase